jgi:hypothetical protein
MSKKTYDILTTVSLFLIAASAILSDKFAQFRWVFGGIAVACALVSTWIYFNHGMEKAREENEQADHVTGAPAAAAPEAEHVNSLSEVLCEPLTCDDMELSEEPEQLDEITLNARPGAQLYLSAAKSLRLTSFYFSRVISIPHHRTFAEEVVGIVRGLTEPGENPRYEFEFKADGTFRVVPCAQRALHSDEKKRKIESLDAVEPRGQLLH